MPKRLEVKTGDNYGRLTIIKEVDKKGRRRRFLCKCDCNNHKEVLLEHLISGRVKSCGCLNSELVVDRHTKHGDTNKRLYYIWQSMKQRCLNSNNANYSNYGGRGIKICNDWLSYKQFKIWALNNGYKEDLTIDRKNVNGYYEPSNCRWITMKLQQNNRRNNHLVTMNGVTKNITEWSEELNINKKTLYQRISRWGVEKAFNTPIIK